MTPADLTTARAALGMRAADLGRALELSGRDPGRYVREWEKGAFPIPGPVAVALRLMLEARTNQKLYEAAQAVRAILSAPPSAQPVLELPEAVARPKTRRRG